MTEPLMPYNPYEAPKQSPAARESLPLQSDAPRSRIRAEFFLAFCVIFSLAYNALDELIIRTHFGAWPLLWVNSLIAVVVALASADWKVSPLCCFASVMASDLLAAVGRSWQYAQVPMALGLSLLFSLPSFIIALAISQGFLRVKKHVVPLEGSKVTGYR